MKSRDILVFVIALILAIVVAFLTRLVLKSDDSPEKITVEKKQETVPVLVAASDLSVGDTIDMSAFKWSQWPKTAVSNHFITKRKAASMQNYDKAVVKMPVARGEPVKLADLVAAGDRGVLSALLRPGYRAVTIQIDRSAPISNWIAPGDLVDVLIAKQERAAGSRDYTGHTVVSKVRVLSVDQALERKGKEKPKSPKSVTVEVSPLQAEDLTAALRRGKAVISLHSIFPGRDTDLGVVRKEKEKIDMREVTILRGDQSTKIEVTN